MDTNKITQMIRIAKMHYELNRTQLEIAKKEINAIAMHIRL